jgi:hypothetical protein
MGDSPVRMVMSDANGSDAPKRAVRLTLELQADTRSAMVSALYSIADRVDRGELSRGCTGGPDSGWVYDYVETESPTHDEYFAQVRAWLKRQSLR